MEAKQDIHILLRYGFTGYTFTAIMLSFCYFARISPLDNLAIVSLKEGGLFILFAGLPLGAIFHWMYYGLYVSFGRDIENEVLLKIIDKIGIRIDKGTLCKKQRAVLRLFLGSITEYILADDDKSEHRDKVSFMYSRVHAIGNMLTAIMCANLVNIILYFYRYKGLDNKYFPILSILGIFILCVPILFYRQRAKECLIMYQLDYIYKHKDKILGNIKQLPEIIIKKDLKGNEIVEITKDFIKSISLPLMRWKNIML